MVCTVDPGTFNMIWGGYKDWAVPELYGIKRRSARYSQSLPVMRYIAVSVCVLAAYNAVNNATPSCFIGFKVYDRWRNVSSDVVR